MDKYDPNDWSSSFVMANKYFCLSRLEEIKEHVIDCLRERNYSAAIVGLDRMLNGALTIHNAGVENMMPFMATNSFNQGIIIVCSMKNAPEKKRRETAIAAFSDARDYAKSSLKSSASDVVDMLESGRDMDSIANELFPDFPDGLIDLMTGAGKKDESDTQTLDSYDPSYSSSGGKTGKAILAFVIGLIIGIAAVVGVYFAHAGGLLQKMGSLSKQTSYQNNQMNQKEIVDLSEFSLTGRWKSAKKEDNGQGGYINIDYLTFGENGEYELHYQTYYLINDVANQSCDMPPFWHVGDCGYPLFSGQCSISKNEAEQKIDVSVDGIWEYEETGRNCNMDILVVDSETIIINGDYGNGETYGVIFKRGEQYEDNARLCEDLGIDINSHY